MSARTKAVILSLTGGWQRWSRGAALGSRQVNQGEYEVVSLGKWGRPRLTGCQIWKAAVFLDGAVVAKHVTINKQKQHNNTQRQNRENTHPRSWYWRTLDAFMFIFRFPATESAHTGSSSLVQVMDARAPGLLKEGELCSRSPIATAWMPYASDLHDVHHKTIRAIGSS
nr:hypothetical protein CFP56_63959 [Quercus suber]